MKISLRKPVRTVRGIGNVWNPQSSNVVAGLGFDFNVGNVLKSYINDVIANYQAKLGQFLIYDQTLADLAKRAVNLAKYPSTQLASGTLALDIKNAQTNQSTLKTSGFAIISVVNDLQKNPIVIDAMAGKLPSVVELEKWNTLTNFVNNAGNAKNSILTWLAQVDQQTAVVNDLINRTKNLEGSVGVSAGGFNLKSVPVGVWIGIGFIGIKFAGKGIIKAIRGRK